MRGATALIAAMLIGLPSIALGQANCRNTGSFEAWLADFKKEALAKGVSAPAIAAASPYLVLDQRIINIDRGQRFFAQNFVENDVYFPEEVRKLPMFQERLRREVPAQRLGTPEEDAMLAVFLASDECSFMVGQSLPFAGGWVT